MNQTRAAVQKIQFLLATAATLFGCTQVQAKPVDQMLLVQSSNQPSKQQSDERSTFAAPPPPDIGAPDRRSDAGSRGCRAIDKQLSLSTLQKPLTALVPIYKTRNTRLVGGLTTSKHPTFWFYIPHPLTTKHSIELVLKDEQGNYVYKNKSSEKMPSGVVGLRLPDSVFLKANKDYSWHFLIYCDSPTPSSYVNGSIRRVKRPALKSQLKSIGSQQRAIVYVREGIWYDALTELAKLRRAYPKNENIQDDWVSLLQSVGLNDLASEPIVSCCSLNN